MDDEACPDAVRKDFEQLFEQIARKEIDAAKSIVEKLKKDMPYDPDLMRAEMLIRRAERKQ